jgi:hypothetical protein
MGQSNEEMRAQLGRNKRAAALASAVPDAAFEQTGLRGGVLGKALDAFEKAYTLGLSESSVVTVIDYELHSSKKRLWVIDLKEQKLLFHDYATHGRGSDRDHDGNMDSVSNTPDSNQSNVGLLKTAETYTGRHGKSLRMDGLEPGFNDNARDRNIVVHPANYADDRYIERNGKAGRSHGCPALDPHTAGDIIQTIKGGTLVFAYYPDDAWLEQSRFMTAGQ